MFSIKELNRIRRRHALQTRAREGGDLIDVLEATYNHSSVGRKAVLELSDDKKQFQIIVSNKFGFAESEKNYSPYTGQTVSNRVAAISGKEFFEDENGNQWAKRIYLFNTTIDKNSLNETNALFINNENHIYEHKTKSELKKLGKRGWSEKGMDDETRKAMETLEQEGKKQVFDDIKRLTTEDVMKGWVYTLIHESGHALYDFSETIAYQTEIKAHEEILNKEPRYKQE